MIQLLHVFDDYAVHFSRLETRLSVLSRIVANYRCLTIRLCQCKTENVIPRDTSGTTTGLTSDARCAQRFPWFHLAVADA